MSRRKVSETVPFTPGDESLSSRLANQLASGEIDSAMCADFAAKIMAPGNPIGEVVTLFLDKDSFGSETGSIIVHTRMQKFFSCVLLHIQAEKNKN